jgi:hypothetical protein
MANKVYTVNFKLMELSASHYWQSTQVEAPSIGRAVDLAWKVVKQRPVVKGKRLKNATITVIEDGLTTD